MGPHGMHHSMMFFGHGILWMFWAVLLAAVVFYAVRYFTEKGPRQGTKMKGGALQLLQERFARGEINKEEYLERKLTLEM